VLTLARKILFKRGAFVLKSKTRIFIIFIVKALIILTAMGMAFSLRYDFAVQAYWSRMLALVPAVLVIKLAVFWCFGLFRGWWRYVSMPDLVQIFKANVFASLLFVFYAVIVYRLDQIPRSVLILDGLFCFMLMGGVRLVTRAFREQFLPMLTCLGTDKKRVLIVGAGNAGQVIVRELQTSPHLQMDLVGFIDDDPLKRHTVIRGVKVLGCRSELARIVREKRIDEVIIAIPSASGSQIKSIVELCRSLAVTFRTLPRVADLIDGSISVQQLRNVRLEDLLGREPISLDQAQISRYLKGKRVLVTGAGGSIGSEICRQVVRFNPEKLILFDNAETPLFQIEQELLAVCDDVALVPIIGDIRNPARINVIFDEQMPQVVFHAAAYKHVPMMENNPAEAVNNNVRGTKQLADAALSFGVETFVMVSTDKAVNPTNVMGASKRAAELYVQSLSSQSTTRFVTTRFGNVLGSNGSVIPTFKKQIKQGGPVTVTHPEVTRYFMTIPEATQLVLQAGSMGKGGEIYLFDMGEPVKIIDLAEELIRLSGLQPHEDIEIVYTGLRPGEKLYEELLLAQEGTLPTHHEKICIAGASESSKELLDAQLEKLFAAAKALDLVAVRKQLRVIVPEYQPAENKRVAKVIPHPASMVM
jgi:FlaA1/EpsC-like NDP-sugar epimerase